MSLDLDDETLELLGWGGERAEAAAALALEARAASTREYFRAYMARYRSTSPLAKEHRARERQSEAAKARRAAWLKTPKGLAYLARKKARRAAKEATP